MLIVALGGKRGRRGRIVLYGPDGSRIKSKKVKNRRKEISLPLKDGILQPGITYSVKFFAFRRRRGQDRRGQGATGKAQVLLLSALDFAFTSSRL